MLNCSETKGNDPDVKIDYPSMSFVSGCSKLAFINKIVGCVQGRVVYWSVTEKGADVVSHRGGCRCFQSQRREQMLSVTEEDVDVISHRGGYRM